MYSKGYFAVTYWQLETVLQSFAVNVLYFNSDLNRKQITVKKCTNLTNNNNKLMDSTQVSESVKNTLTGDQ